MDLLALFQQQHKQDWAFTVDVKGQAPDTFRVLSFQWQEQLSELYAGSITLASRSSKIHLNDCLDKNIVLKIHHKDDMQVRYLHGVIESISIDGVSDHWTHYRVNVEPILHRLDLVSDARIYQQESVPDIINKILIEQGITDFEFRLKDTHLQREYCVQYRETYLSFFERLLAEEGIFYFWEQTKEGAKLIMSDLTQFGTPLKASPILVLNNQSGGNIKGQFVQTFQWNESVRSTGLTQRDYSFLHPRYTQQQQVNRNREGGEHADYELYNGYGRYKEDDSGSRFTQYQLEGLRNDASTGHGQSNGMHLGAGYRFELAEHPTDYLNRPYLLVSVAHSGQQPQALEEHAGDGATTYNNQFLTHAESEYSWRPKQKYKPMVDGPQIAHVVGPPGEEIYTDEYGRVKLHFPWDRYSEENDKSSCWVRVSQAWAGTRFGAIAIPRIGQEVIVDFLEGDPDQPIVIGRTYHSMNMPPYDLPANKTQTGIKTRSTQSGDASTFNELRFEDKIGQEQVYIHAEKNQDNVVENDETTNVGRDRSESVGNDETIAIGNNRTESVGHDETISIGNDQHNTIGKNQHHHITQNRLTNIGKDEVIKVGNHRKLDVYADQYQTTGGHHEHTINGRSILKVGEKITSLTTVHELSGSDKVVFKGPAGTIVMDSSGITLKGKVTIKGTLAIESGSGGGKGFDAAPATGIPICTSCLMKGE